MNGTLNLPPNVLIATIRKYRDQLNERFEHIKNKTHESSVLLQQSPIIPKPSGSGVRVVKPRPTKIIPLKSYRERINFEKVIVSHLILFYLFNDCLSCNFVSDIL